MRKVIKISVHTLSAIVLAAIILPIFIGLAIQLPFVQNYAVRKASQWASSRLEARVAIERIDLKFFSRAQVRGFYVEDYGGDTLMYVGNVDAEVLHTGLLGGRFTLGRTRISDVRFMMHEDPDSTTNFRKIIEKIKRKNPPEERNPFEINITDLEVDNLYYSLRRLDPLDRQGAVNFRDLEVQRFDLRATGVRIIGDSVKMDIERMSFREKTGLEVPWFSARIENLSGNFISVSDVRLMSGRTDLNLASMAFYAGGWEVYKNFIDDIRLEGEIRPSVVDMATIACFAPTVAGIDYVFSNLEGTASGRVADMYGTIANIGLAGTSAGFDYRMRGLPDIEQTVFDVDGLTLRTSSQGIAAALAGVVEDPLPDRLRQALDGMGAIDFTGSFHGSYTDFTAEGDLRADNSGVRFDVTVDPVAGSRLAYSGNLGVYGLDAGLLAGVPLLGRAALRGSFSGQLGGDGFTIDADATIPLAEFNGYRYRDIEVKGAVENRRFEGTVSSADENIDFDLEGMFDLNDSIPRYDLSLHLRNADLAALNVAKKDTVSVLRFDARAIGSGANPDNLNGTVTVTDLTYINDTDSVWTGRLDLRGVNSEYSKYLSFDSYFADAEYRSRTSYEELVPQLRSTLRSYLPTLIRDGEREQAQGGQLADAGNYSLLSVNIKEANKAVGIFVPGLILAKGTRMSFMFNPNVGQVSLTASSEYVEYRNNFVSNLEINSRNEGDSLSVFVRADDMYAGGLFMPNFSVIGGLKDNRINASARFMDSVRNMTALVGVATRFDREPQTGMTRVNLGFTPSSINIGERVWNIYSRGITIDSTRIDIRNFTILGSGQDLTVDGAISRSREDTLHLNMRNFDLEPLTNLTARLGYDVGGRTNGHADLVAGKGDAVLHARVEFDSVTLNGKMLPDGLFESTWDFPNERARFALSSLERGDTVVLGYYRPATRQYFGQVRMDNIDISLVEPFFQGILRDTEGRVNVEALVSGERRQLAVNGQALLPYMRTTVDYLNVPYELRDAVIRVEDNVIKADSLPVYDPLGNIAMFEMNVDLNSTQNVHYNLLIRPQDFLAMDLERDYNDLFYGRAFASGTVEVRGDRRGVNIDITATTGDNSEFFMPLGGYSMGLSDIITFRQPESPDRPQLNEYQQRKMSIIRRRRRREAGEGGGLQELNINLTARPNLLFTLIIDPRSGDEMKARGNGNITLRFNPSADELRMNGVYEITDGSYQFSLQGIINKSFSIEPDSRITWFNDPLDADLDVSAVYNLRASLAPLLYNYYGSERSFSTVPVECRIMLSGNLEEPDITFDIEVPNADPEIRSLIANELSTQESISTQFLALLALNSFYSSENGNIGSAGGSALAIDFLSNQLSSLISNDNIHIGFRFNQQSDLTSDEFGLGLSADLFSKRVLLEFEGNYNAHNQTGFAAPENASNITGDFYLTWLVDKSGNLRLRGFTRTIDRFEDYGLQESGMGLYYREDFNTIGDIVRNFKDRFSRKEKRRKKRAEAESSDKND
ncbi:MAG: translocation/assembly module TamB [Alistipes sp.]|nr:translocation/assembly module TamB [Alistipes sp.]